MHLRNLPEVTSLVVELSSVPWQSAFRPVVPLLHYAVPVLKGLGGSMVRVWCVERAWPWTEGWRVRGGISAGPAPGSQQRHQNVKAHGTFWGLSEWFYIMYVHVDTLCVYMYTIHTLMYIHIHVHTYTQTHCIYTHLHIYTYICFIYTDILYIHIYIHTI